MGKGLRKFLIFFAITLTVFSVCGLVLAFEDFFEFPFGTDENSYFLSSEAGSYDPTRYMEFSNYSYDQLMALKALRPELADAIDEYVRTHHDELFPSSSSSSSRPSSGSSSGGSNA